MTAASPPQHTASTHQNRTNAIDREELYGIADAWVETAMTLPADCLRRIDRLVANQGRSFGEPPAPAFEPIAHAG
ncbi:MAG: hypothetical protein H6977_17620 [Gammaproteobacteria bacterium]|nr:hypothetical protein [Gammaproteobacteria bacterium]